MGRKQLLTMLATLVAAIGLQAAPAAAQSLDLPGVSVDAEDGLELDVEVQVTDDLELDPELEIDLDAEEPVTVDGGVKAGDVEVDLGDVDLGEVTKPPATPEPAPDPSPEAPDPQPSEDVAPETNDDAGDAAAGGEGGDDAGEAADERERRRDEVVASGGAFNWTPQRQAQFEAFRAMRNYDFGFGPTQASVLPGVELAPRRAAAPDDEVSMLEYDEPMVAPGVAAASEPVGEDDATFAATPANQPVEGVPLPLQVLTGLLVAGTAMAWNLTRRELSWAFSGLSRH